MKISFVIPAYNEESCLAQCLNSISRELKKTKCDAEIVVVDNGSTDKTAEIAHSFPGVKLVYEPKKGISSARHAGYLAASGDLIANVDADTKLTPGWIGKVQKYFSKDPKLIALSGPFVYHDISAPVRSLIRGYYILVFGVHLLNHRVLGLSSVLQGGNYIIKKSALDKVRGYNPEYEFWGEDADIARRLHPHGKVKFALRLPIYSSGRRLAAEGILKTGGKYVANYFWVVFFKKPLMKKTRHIRTGR